MFPEKYSLLKKKPFKWCFKYFLSALKLPTTVYEKEICCSKMMLTPYLFYFYQQLAKKNEQMWKQLDQQNKELEEKRKQFEREKAQYEEEQKNSGQKGLERSDSSSKSLK